MSKAIKEALKEFSRVILLATIPVLADLLSTPNPNLKASILVLVVAALRAIDKYMHEKAPTGEAGGLTGF